MSDWNLSRRNILKLFGLGAATALTGCRSDKATATGLPGSAPRWNTVAATPARTRALRVAHITDIHVQPELGAPVGFSRSLQHLQSLKDKPALILNTGDCIMDSMGRDETRTRLQWDIWKRVLRDDCSLPVESAIGNHDCWGINRAKSKMTGSEPLYGKKMAMEQLGLAMPYRSFDRNGWHFIALDSTSPFNDSYKAQLGTEQMAWLKQDLERSDKSKPVCVLSHIPIFSPAAVINSGRPNAAQQLEVGGGQMHLDVNEIHAAFRKHGNVKLCLSGHLHILDRAEYDGISYISTGAVCGGWWKGKHREKFDNGYATVDLYTDGSFDYAYHTYGWTVVPPATKPAAAAANA